MLPRKLKFFQSFVDGLGYQGETQELVQPKLTRKMEEYRAGGMLAPIDIDLGMEKLTSEITMGANIPDMLGKFGMCNTEAVAMRFMGSAQADDSCEMEAIEVVMRGRWSEIDADTWKGGDDTSTKYTATLAYYKYISNGEVIIEIDVARMIYIVRGEDLYAEHRRNIGLTY